MEHIVTAEVYGLKLIFIGNFESLLVKEINVRNQRKIVRKMFNLKCLGHRNLHDLGQPIASPT
jgi:hypothetical protein